MEDTTFSRFCSLSVGAAPSVDVGFEKGMKADEIGSWILAMFLQGHRKAHVGDSALEPPSQK
jgi:hypothetical protein